MEKKSLIANRDTVTKAIIAKGDTSTPEPMKVTAAKKVNSAKGLTARSARSLRSTKSTTARSARSLRSTKSTGR